MGGFALTTNALAEIILKLTTMTIYFITLSKQLYFI